MKPVEPSVMRPHRYLRARRDAKGKAVFSSNSKLMPGKHWNESKKASLRIDQNGAICRWFSASIAAATAATATTSAVPAANRWTSWNYPTKNCRCRTRKAGSSRHHWSCRPNLCRKCRRLRSRAGSCGFAPGSSAGSKSARFRRPPPECRHSAHHRVLRSRAGLRYLCTAIADPSHFVATGHARSLIIQAKYGTFAGTDHLTVLCSTRKVRP